MNKIPLMVIDMQENFLSINKELNIVTPQVIHQVRLAKKRKAPIIFVEFRGFGPTIPAITTLTETYPIHLVLKGGAAVGPFLTDSVKQLLTQTKKLRVCGVYTNACVQQSVRSLLDRFSKLRIEVMKKACGNSWGTPIFGNFQWFSRRERVLLNNYEYKNVDHNL